ncbi:MAG TPA: SMI1/KNR4 family protein [Verrucomicrobiae bacterium]|nr:SMI1/KNR4 family protein [Verrucomicrobiae bacterium]
MHYLQEILGIIQRDRGLGFRELPNGTQLIGRVPHVAPNAWLHELFPPISDTRIDGVQSEIGMLIPEAFRDFLSLGNGIRLFSGSVSIYGVRENYERGEDAVWQPFDLVAPNTVERLRDAKNSYLFVGGYPEGRGSYLYISNDDQKVYRCSRQSCEPLNRWESFPQMLLTEARRLATLFDRNGRRLDSSKAVTPQRDL